jgi:hypothetical protein
VAAERIELRRTSPDGSRAFTATFRGECVDGEFSTLHLTAMLATRGSRRALALEVPESSTLPLLDGRFSDDGTFYFETGTRVLRFPPGASTGVADLPHDIHLTTLLMMPLTTPVCDC